MISFPKHSSSTGFLSNEIHSGKLPQKEFVRLCRSYIIPIKKVKAIVNKNIQIEEFLIPIGDTYKEVVNKFMSL